MLDVTEKVSTSISTVYSYANMSIWNTRSQTLMYDTGREVEQR